jgi:asparagine synthase (glutamine-hydrolysing)
VARDRLGQKPVHYWIDADGLSFASEPKAFLADPGFTPEADPAAIAHYLTFQYVPTPFSAFRGVRKLPPGSYLLVEGGQVRVERYWRLQYGRKNRISEAEAAEELRARIAEAVRLRLVSDVPLGAFLSGGIDSGIIVAMMAQQAGGRVKTFSIGFDQKEYDELPAARLVAERYGTEHHEFVVRPDALALLPALVWHYNEPYADSSAIPTFVLSELTRRYVTVALNGDAGDENFAGYERYVANALGSRIDRIPRPLRRCAARAAARIPGKRAPRSVLGRAKRLVEAAGEDRAQRYVRWMSHFHSELRRDVCQPEFLTTAGVDPERQLLDAYEESDAPDLVDATLDLDVRTYLPDDLLVKVDIATMAHGLEARSPFLDHELMEFAAALPSRYKLHGLVKKYILRKAGEPLLPAHILERPKMGFGVPIDAWFRGALKPVVYDLIGSTRFRDRGVLRPERVARMLDEHARGVRSWHYQLWNVLMLELWYRAFIDQRPAAFADVAAAIGPLIVLPAA